MIVIISGTNRSDNRSSQVAELCRRTLETAGEHATVLDLRELPAALFRPEAYATRPPEFEPFQRAVLDATGILTIVPEYNGSFPGVLKLFIDMLRFPESLVGMPAAFVGVAAGEWGGLRAVEQLELIFQYRHAHLFGRRVFLKNIDTVLSTDGQLTDHTLNERLGTMVRAFAAFSHAVNGTGNGPK